MAWALALAAREVGAAVLLRRVGRVLVPVALVAATLVQGAELVAESWRLV